MNDASSVRCIKRIRDLDGKLEQFCHWQRLCTDLALQSLPFQKFHGDEGLTLVFIHVVNGTNIGMVQCRRGIGFTLKSF